jgi:hypothetical protein
MKHTLPQLCMNLRSMMSAAVPSSLPVAVSATGDSRLASVEALLAQGPGLSTAPLKGYYKREIIFSTVPLALRREPQNHREGGWVRRVQQG